MPVGLTTEAAARSAWLSQGAVCVPALMTRRWIKIMSHAHVSTAQHTNTLTKTVKYLWARGFQAETENHTGC